MYFFNVLIRLPEKVMWIFAFLIPVSCSTPKSSIENSLETKGEVHFVEFRSGSILIPELAEYIYNEPKKNDFTDNKTGILRSRKISEVTITKNNIVRFANGDSCLVEFRNYSKNESEYNSLLYRILAKDLETKDQKTLRDVRIQTLKITFPDSQRTFIMTKPDKPSNLTLYENKEGQVHYSLNEYRINFLGHKEPVISSNLRDTTSEKYQSRKKEIIKLIFYKNSNPLAMLDKKYEKTRVALFFYPDTDPFDKKIIIALSLAFSGGMSMY